MYLFALPYLALVFGNLLATTVVPDGGSGFNLVWTVGALICLAGAFATNYFGVEIGVRFGLILGLVEITVLVVMSVWMISVSGDANSLSLFTTSHANIPGFEGINGVIAASVYGFLAFIGFEAAAPLAEETQNPRRNVPRAVVLSCLLIGLFYVLTAYSSTVYFGPDKMANFMAYNGGNAWIGLAKTLWGNGWIVLVVVLMISSFACMNAAALAATRSMWAMGRSGTIPSFFGRVHPRWRSPSKAIIVFFVLGTILTLVGGYVWDPVTAYSVFGTALTVCVLPIYFVTALACPVYYLRYRRSELNVFLHVIVPVLGAILLVPAFLAGAGIPIVSFATPLSWPLSLPGRRRLVCHRDRDIDLSAHAAQGKFAQSVGVHRRHRASRTGDGGIGESSAHRRRSGPCLTVWSRHEGPVDTDRDRVEGRPGTDPDAEQSVVAFRHATTGSPRYAMVRAPTSGVPVTASAPTETVNTRASRFGFVLAFPGTSIPSARARQFVEPR
jgi:amino acid transporter